MLPPVRLHSDRDHGLQVAAKRDGVDVGMDPADHPAFHERPHPSQAGRRRDTGQRCERSVGRAGIARELIEQDAVDAVERRVVSAASRGGRLRIRRLRRGPH
ncbi:hypothetical protein AZG88_36470 [Rhodococcus sp. LB1]|nr:hypothetical protein AZG88_36470 [Rhodococcus sp. LB1]